MESEILDVVARVETEGVVLLGVAVKVTRVTYLAVVLVTGGWFAVMGYLPYAEETFVEVA